MEYIADIAVHSTISQARMKNGTEAAQHETEADNIQ
jgi:hypothetical protein